MYFLSENRLYSKTIAGVAKAFGRDPALMHKWWTQGCPKGRRGKYDIFAIAEWLADRKTGGESTPEADIQARLKLAQLKRAEADAELRALEAAERSAELMPVGDVARGNVDRARALRSVCDRLKSELPPLVKMKELAECRKIIGPRIDRMVDQYTDAAPAGAPKKGRKRGRKRTNATRRLDRR